ncbi:MAG TPA: hypothetical protein VGV92_00665 [Gammaproteobacteria bacterium]|nr:hypothetical protein [Gammaproteobacteria bacterium]
MSKSDADTTKGNQLAFFGPAETPADARLVLKVCAIALCCLGMLSAVVGAIFAQPLLLTGLYCFAYAPLIYFIRNSTVTLVCFLWSLINIVIVMHHSYVVLPVLMSIMLIRAMLATSAWHKLTEPPANN